MSIIHEFLFQSLKKMMLWLSGMPRSSNFSGIVTYTFPILVA